MVDLQEQTADRGAAQYQQELRAAVRGLWSGGLDDIDAGAMFDNSIRRSFTKAYHDGAKSVGVLPVELTPQERQQLQNLISAEFAYVDGFLLNIMQNSKANGGKLKPLFGRIKLWMQRYQQVYTAGQTTAKDDPKMRWVQTAAEGCKDCIRLNGKVKRLSQWQAVDLYPQSPRLECMRSAAGPAVCKCHFEKTTERLSSGPLPRI